MLHVLPYQGATFLPNPKRQTVLYLYRQMQAKSGLPGPLRRRYKLRPHPVRRLGQPLTLPLNLTTPRLIEGSPTFRRQFIQHIS